MATKKPAQAPGRDVVTTLTVEFIGVGLVTLLAGTSKQMGKITVVIMSGFLLGWLLINAKTLEGWVKKA
jgi:hypothetical protein